MNDKVEKPAGGDEAWRNEIQALQAQATETSNTISSLRDQLKALTEREDPNPAKISALEAKLEAALTDLAATKAELAEAKAARNSSPPAPPSPPKSGAGDPPKTPEPPKEPEPPKAPERKNKRAWF